jgi:hypothetical protein
VRLPCTGLLRKIGSALVQADRKQEGSSRCGEEPSKCSSGLGWLGRLDGVHDAVDDFVDSADAVNLGEDSTFGVLGHNGLGLLVVQVQAVADDGLIVVAAAGLLGAAQKACNEFLLVSGQLQDDVEALVTIGQDLVQVINLRPCARVAVQQEAVVDVAPAEAVADHLVGHAVRNEVPGVHVLLRFDTERRFTRDVRAEDVAGGDRNDAEALRDVSKKDAKVCVRVQGRGNRPTTSAVTT